MRYIDREKLSQNPIAQKLFRLIEDKQSNLCVSADLTEANQIIELVKKVGDEICLLKTHIDIVKDFSLDFIHELLDLKRKHQFMIFEDRKFADIGNTVQMQYQGGIYRIVEWADIVNAHILPGPGIIEGLRKVGLPKGRGLLLLAEMSSAGNLLDAAYAKKTVEFAEKYDDFVFGFIAQRRVIDDPKFIVMTPGVKLEAGKDDLQQQYRTPESAIVDGSDVIIVGRGIYAADNPGAMAKVYREKGWGACL